MAIKRISTAIAIKTRPAIAIEFTDKTIAKLEHTDLTTFDTEAKIITELERQAKQVIPNIFVHINRDGSLAVASGAEPTIWPEDEPDYTKA